MNAEFRQVPVAVSIDALMQQWARRDSAPAGSALVVGTEIAARLRGGVGWRKPEPLAAAVLARPVTLDPSSRDLAWLAAGLGAARALDACLGDEHPDEHQCAWPDAVVLDSGADAEVVVSVVCALASGRVDYAILIVRLGPTGSFTPAVDAVTLVDELRIASQLLDEPDDLVAGYNRRCATVGRTVAVTLLPHGSTRGVVLGACSDGRLEIESPTGLRERIAVSSFSSLRRLDG